MDDETLPSALRPSYPTPPTEAEAETVAKTKATPDITPSTLQSLGSMRFTIKGEQIQYIEILLSKGESVIGEADDMMYFEDGVRFKMQAVHNKQTAKGGFFKKLLGMGKSVAVGARLFMATFTNTSEEDKKVTFLSPVPGKIIPINLRDIGGGLICEKTSFICASSYTTIRGATQKESGAGVFGGGIAMKKITGDDTVFIHSGGEVFEKELKEGETLNVSAKSIVAVQPTVAMRVKTLANIDTNDNGFRLVHVNGPGKIWLQSLPFSMIREDNHRFTIEKLEQSGIKMKVLKKKLK